MAVGNMLSAVLLRRYVELWLSESESLTARVELGEHSDSSRVVRAEIVQGEGGVLAGRSFVEAVYTYLSCTVQWHCAEGSDVQQGCVVGQVRGEAGRVLQGCKVVEAVLRRCSGAATEARRLCSRLQDTRDSATVWRGEVVRGDSMRYSVGLGAVDEWGGRVGGLSAAFTGSVVTLSSSSRRDSTVGSMEGGDNVTERVRRVRERRGRTLQVEVQCSNEDEALEGAASTANILSLHNMGPQDVLSISKKVKDINPAVLVKVSGKITEDNIVDFATSKVDIISSTIFNQGYKCIDFSVNIVDDVLSIESEPIQSAPVEMLSIVETTVKNNDNNNSIINNNDIIEIDLIELDVFDKEASTITSTTTATKKIVDNTTNNKVNNKRKLDDKAANGTEEMSITMVTPPVSKVTTVGKVTTVSTTAIDNSTLQQKKPEEKVVTKTVVTPRAKFQPVNKIQRLNNNKTNITKVITNNNNNNNINRNSSSLYQQQQQQQSSSMSSLNSARMPGMPVSMSTPRAISLHNNMNNNSMNNGQLALGDTNIFRAMSLQSFPNNNNGNQLLLQPQQHDDAFFRGDAPIRYGGSSTTGRTAMNNDQRNNNNNNNAMLLMNRSNPRFVICKGCNFQNPANGAPLCRRCRSLLIVGADMSYSISVSIGN